MAGFDLQISGAEHDGSETGQVRANIVASGLVAQEWRRGMYSVTSAGTTAITFREEGVVSTFGTNSGWHIQITKPAIPGTLCEIKFAFRGRRFALGYMRKFGTDQPDFALFIDGMAFKVQIKRYLLVEDTDASLQESAVWYCPEMLDDGEHECRLVILPQLQSESGVGDNVWFINCFFVGSRAGYPAHPVRGLATLPYLPTTLTTSYANLPTRTTDATLDFGISGQEWRWFRKITYQNTGASPVTVSIAKGNVLIKEINLAAAGSAGSWGEFDPGGPVNFDNSQAQANARSWSHKASAGSVVTWQMYGGVG